MVLCNWVMGSWAVMRNSEIESLWNARACGRKSLPCSYSKTLGSLACFLKPPITFCITNDPWSTALGIYFLLHKSFF